MTTRRSRCRRGNVRNTAAPSRRFASGGARVGKQFHRFPSLAPPRHFHAHPRAHSPRRRAVRRSGNSPIVFRALHGPHLRARCCCCSSLAHWLLSKLRRARVLGRLHRPALGSPLAAEKALAYAGSLRDTACILISLESSIERRAPVILSSVLSRHMACWSISLGLTLQVV